MKILKNTLFLLSVLIVILLYSCHNNAENKSPNSNQAQVMKDSLVIPVPVPDILKTFLINSTAQDFYKHRQNEVDGFRNVFLRLYEGKTYLICGEVLVKNKEQADKWIDFATLKTEGYELWIGGNATTYCNDAKTVASSTGDLASSLNTELKNLQSVPGK